MDASDTLYHTIMVVVGEYLDDNAEARAIIDAGLEPQLRSLLRQIAGAASRPIRDPRD